MEDKAGSKTKEVEESVGVKKFIKTNDMKKVKIRFNDLPISKYTIKGLTKAQYVKMTEVQR
jgi:superfamily II DNA/RNA helicase